MKLGWMVLVVAALALVAADSADARAKKPRARCVDQPKTFSWNFLLPGQSNYVPRPNGCAPPVYAYGRYVGQDPDPYIRLQLLRDPGTGYTPFAN